MKILSVLMALLFLTACTRGAVEPSGTYPPGTAEKAIVLNVRASGDYVLQIDGPDSMTDEIRRRREEERGTGIDITLHGIAWRKSLPEAGRAFWSVAFESNGRICVGGEGAACFSKDEAS